MERLLLTADRQEEKVKFKVLATAEIMRRISIIAKLNIHKHSYEWNPVLHMHLSALHEIPLLFADF